MITKALSELLEMKEDYDKEYDDKDNMPSHVQRCYDNLLTEIRKAAKRNQQTLPGLSRTTPGSDGQMVLM